MIKQKNPTIKTADLEAAINQLEKDIRETDYPTKTAFLSLLKGFRNGLITYDPREEIEIPMYLEVR